MGSFFYVQDDPVNQRVILSRAVEPGSNIIWLDTDPTGAGVTEAPFPDVISKVSLGAAKNGAAFFIDYTDKFKLTTDLAPTLSVADGADATFAIVAAGGASPYTYKWYWNDIYIDPNADPENPNPTAATATLVNHAVTSASAGVYYCVVTDSAGKTITSAKSTLTVT